MALRANGTHPSVVNTAIDSVRPCCWEDVGDDCLAPALPDSLWCVKHTAWAKAGYDPGLDALNARRNLPPRANGEQPTAAPPEEPPRRSTQRPEEHPRSSPQPREEYPRSSPATSREPTPPSGFEDTHSDSFNQPKTGIPGTGHLDPGARPRPGRPSAARCSATTRAGTPCRAYARRPPGDADFRPSPSTLLRSPALCIYHDPEYRGTLRAHARDGGRAFSNAHFGPPDPLDEIMDLPLDLSDRGSVQAVIDGVLRMHLSAQIPPRRSAAILQILNLAVRNVAGSQSPAAFAQSYNRAAPQFLHTSKRAVKHIANEDVRQRVNEISDVKSKRQALLQANAEFGYPYRVEKHR